MPLDRSTNIHLINCSALPTVPEGLTLDKHKASPKVFWRDGLIVAFAPNPHCYRPGGMLDWDAVTRSLVRSRRRMWNANMMDFVLRYPHMLTEEALPCGSFLMFVDTTFKQSNYSTARQKKIQKPRGVFRALHRRLDGTLEARVKERNGHWLRGRDFAAVHPDP